MLKKSDLEKSKALNKIKWNMVASEVKNANVV